MPPPAVSIRKSPFMDLPFAKETSSVTNGIPWVNDRGSEWPLRL